MVQSRVLHISATQPQNRSYVAALLSSNTVSEHILSPSISFAHIFIRLLFYGKRRFMSTNYSAQMFDKTRLILYNIM